MSASAHALGLGKALRQFGIALALCTAVAGSAAVTALSDEGRPSQVVAREAGNDWPHALVAGGPDNDWPRALVAGDLDNDWPGAPTGGSGVIPAGNDWPRSA